ncbi:MAG: dockerin type I domain-containing protein, partial [Rhodanobacteraceae bacterium]
SVTSGTGAAGSPTFSGNTVSVPLTGVTDSEVITLTLSNINGTAATTSVNLGFLVGDSTGDRVVNGNDVSQLKSRSGQAAGAGNFRSDLNLDGTINGNDTSLAKSKSGNSIP